MLQVNNLLRFPTLASIFSNAHTHHRNWMTMSLLVRACTLEFGGRLMRRRAAICTSICSYPWDYCSPHMAYGARTREKSPEVTARSQGSAARLLKNWVIGKHRVSIATTSIHSRSQTTCYLTRPTDSIIDLSIHRVVEMSAVEVTSTTGEMHTL